MRFFIINTDYPQFINWLYSANQNLSALSFSLQYKKRMESLFGTADFYSRNLKLLGHEAWDVIANIEPMQKRWELENCEVRKKNLKIGFRLRGGILPWVYIKNLEWIRSILAEQIKLYRPDVIISLAMELIDTDFLRSVEKYYRIAVGQHAATPLHTDISGYDLVLSSLPSQVEFFRKSGLKSEMLRLGFEPIILERIQDYGKVYELSFVGGFSKIYGEGTDTLGFLAESLPVSIWGHGIDSLPLGSVLRRKPITQVWGKDMYQVLHDSEIVFNRHSDLADRFFANNMRMYETTGIGSCLLTDHKQNIAEIFKPGKEIITYRSQAECLELALYYLQHNEERESIARAGQIRTLSEHTYYHRMQELVDIVRSYL